jgi:hypothetical protein
MMKQQTCVLRLLAVRLHGMHVEVAIRHIRAAIDEIVPEWALLHVDVLHKHIGGVEERPHDRARFTGSIPGCTLSEIFRSATSLMEFTVSAAIEGAAAIDLP